MARKSKQQTTTVGTTIDNNTEGVDNNRENASGGNTKTNSRNTERGNTVDTTEINIEESHGLPVLDLDITVEEKPKRSSRKKPTTTQNKEDKTLESNVSMMLDLVFNIVSVRAGGHWALSTEESQSIAAPAARIISRLIPADTTNKYSDYMLLAVAASLVVVPRVLISKSLKEVKNETTEIKQIHSTTTQQSNVEQTGHVDNGLKGKLADYF